MGRNTPVLETLSVMTGKAVRLDVLSDQCWTELTNLANVSIFEVKARMLKEGVERDLIYRHTNHIRDFRRDAKALFRQYGTQLDGLKTALAGTVFEIEQVRKNDGRPLL